LTSGFVQVFRSFIRQCIYVYVQNYCRRDFGIPPWCKRDLRSSRVKQSTSWTDSPFKRGPIRLSRNKVTNYQSKLRNISEGRIFQNYYCSIVQGAEKPQKVKYPCPPKRNAILPKFLYNFTVQTLPFSVRFQHSPQHFVPLLQSGRETNT